MKVFISWSGEPSQRVAKLLRQYLPRMIQSLEPFMSQRDLSPGGRWTLQLSHALDQTNFGIVCLTPDNLEAPWLLFEAGALTKHLEGRACCLLLRGLRPAQVTGPLLQFQNCSFTKDDFWKLLSDLNDRLDKGLSRDDLQAIFAKWWPDLEKEVNATLADPELGAPIEHKRDQSEILEELLLRVRNVEDVVAHEMDPGDAVRRSDLLKEFLNDGFYVRLDDLHSKYLSEDILWLMRSGLVEFIMDGNALRLV